MGSGSGVPGASHPLRADPPESLAAAHAGSATTALDWETGAAWRGSSVRLTHFPSHLALRLGGSLASSARCRQPQHNGWSPSSPSCVPFLSLLLSPGDPREIDRRLPTSSASQHRAKQLEMIGSHGPLSRHRRGPEAAAVSCSRREGKACSRT